MATGAGAYPEPVIPWLARSRLRLVAVLVLLAAFYSASWHLAKVDPAKLLSGLPRMASWTGKAWPPAMDELPVLLQRTGETIAMAAIGTTAAGLLALPLSVLAARRSEEHTSELQSRPHLVCRLLLEKKNSLDQ